MRSFLLTFHDNALEQAFHKEQFTLTTFYGDIMFLFIAVLSHVVYIIRSLQHQGIQHEMGPWKPVIDGPYTSLLHVYFCGSLVLLDLLIRILMGHERMIPHRTKFAIISRFVLTITIFACVPEHMHSGYTLNCENPLSAGIVTFVLLGGATHMLLVVGVRLCFKHHLWTSFISSVIFAASIPSVRCRTLANTQTEENIRTILHAFSGLMESVMYATFGTMNTSYKTPVIFNPCVLLGLLIHLCFLFLIISFGVWVSERKMRLEFLKKYSGKAKEKELFLSDCGVSPLPNSVIVGHGINLVVGITIAWIALLWLVHSGIPLGLSRPLLPFS